MVTRNAQRNGDWLEFWLHFVDAAWKHGRCYLYLTPTFLLLGVFSYYPPLKALYKSLFRWNMATVDEFIGLGNFRKMLTDEILIESVGNLVILSVFAIVASLTMAFLVAELIFSLRSARAKYWYRIMLVIPMVVPGMVVLLLWQFIYDPNVGVLNALIGLFGVAPQTWLKDPDLALVSIMFMGFPFVGGIGVLILLAGLNNIGQDVFEASKLDGASTLQRILRVDLPLLSGQFRLLVIMGIIGTLNGYQVQLILTNGRPGFATMVPGLHMYHQAFSFGNYGYACALGLVLFVVILSLTMLSRRLIKETHE